MNVFVAAEQSQYRLLHIGVEVNWVDKLHFRENISQLSDGCANLLEALAEILSSVASDKRHRLRIR